mmetsp:Transcript_46820/g.117989  ORF Transcript_46820/g.117989 Transcript_46820/m.117989 type:complete len:238 (-) Transcript_46820:1044-1757(-)
MARADQHFQERLVVLQLHLLGRGARRHELPQLLLLVAFEEVHAHDAVVKHNLLALVLQPAAPLRDGLVQLPHLPLRLLLVRRQPLLVLRGHAGCVLLVLRLQLHPVARVLRLQLGTPLRVAVEVQLLLLVIPHHRALLRLVLLQRLPLLRNHILQQLLLGGNLLLQRDGRLRGPLLKVAHSLLHVRRVQLLLLLVVQHVELLALSEHSLLQARPHVQLVLHKLVRRRHVALRQPVAK